MRVRQAIGQSVKAGYDGDLIVLDLKSIRGFYEVDGLNDLSANIMSYHGYKAAWCIKNKTDDKYYGTLDVDRNDADRTVAVTCVSSDGKKKYSRNLRLSKGPFFVHDELEMMITMIVKYSEKMK